MQWSEVAIEYSCHTFAALVHSLERRSGCHYWVLPARLSQKYVGSAANQSVATAGLCDPEDRKAGLLNLDLSPTVRRRTLKRHEQHGLYT